MWNSIFDSELFLTSDKASIMLHSLEPRRYRIIYLIFASSEKHCNPLFPFAITESQENRPRLGMHTKQCFPVCLSSLTRTSQHWGRKFLSTESHIPFLCMWELQECFRSRRSSLNVYRDRFGFGGRPLIQYSQSSVSLFYTNLCRCFS